MAGDWIKWVKGLADKREVIQMAVELNIPRTDVAGRLMRVWEWADDNCDVDGNAPSVTKAFVDETVGAHGFADAMQKAGWLHVNSGGLAFPNFERHNAQPAKRRALTQRRVKRLRNAASVTDVTLRALPEKRRIEKSNKPPLPPKGGDADAALAEHLPAGSVLDCPNFYAAWRDWWEHRREIRKRLTPTAIRKQLKELEAWGADRAIAAIEHTVAKGWTGLREPETTGNGSYQNRNTDGRLARVEAKPGKYDRYEPSR